MNERVRIKLWLETFSVFLRNGYEVSDAAQQAGIALDLFMERFND